MTKDWDVIVVGSGNAALCAGIAACEAGSRVLMIEKAGPDLAGGNTKYTAGAMRFAFEGSDDLLPLLAHPDDPRVARSDFGSYTADKFRDDLLKFNDGAPITDEQAILIGQSYSTMVWLASHGVTFDPIYARQSFEKDGKLVFWGGLALAAENEGVGLYDMELAAFERLGGTLRYDTPMTGLLTEGDRVVGVQTPGGDLRAPAVVLACGGFESSAALRVEHLGPEWQAARVRGTPMNTGDGLSAAQALGAATHGRFDSCHATPMDLHMQEYGNLDIPHKDRKNYRKISYFLGVMLNRDGQRFVDEGKDFRNYTYAQFGGEILRQPGQVAWQIFDSQVRDLLYGEYDFYDAHFETADTLEAVLEKCEGLDAEAALATLQAFNAATDAGTPFDPTIKDGKATKGLALPKSNWAVPLTKGPFWAYPVTGGITFSYGGLKVSASAEVLRDDGAPIDGLFACGELVGGVFLGGYPGGSGLTSGAVFGRIAGRSAAG